MTMKLPEPVEKFKKQHPAIYDLLHDVALALVIVAVVGGLLYAYSGTWPPVVSIISDSMVPHMNKGDLVLLQGLDRTSVVTSAAANASGGHTTFGLTGNVIVYYPMGDRSEKPVIHRAMYWVNQSEPMWPDGPAAPASGYITLGDANGGTYDQDSNICPLQPVRPDWIVGVATFDVPYVGYLRALIPF